MLLSTDIKYNSELPVFIKTCEIFDHISTFEKIFPLIGLKNFTIKYDSQKARNSVLKNEWARIISRINDIRNDTWSTKIASYIPILFSFAYNLVKEKSSRIYKEKKIIFSADGMQGAWDIATMSMRGIFSCQTWGSSYSDSLVGSIIDPCCGIINLTDDSTYNNDVGSKMIHRAVVRFIVSPTRGPAIFMEKLYSYKKYDSMSLSEKEETNKVTNAFIDILTKRSGLKVISVSSRNYFIPNSDAVSALSNIFPTFLSYRDSGIRYEVIDFEPPMIRNKYPLLKEFVEKFATKLNLRAKI